jgi:4-hydroxybenzoyl-CoA thioesterase/acyl-CoA thioester hydrolase
MTEFKWPFRVYIEDTDAGGIVYYVNYLKFMERARTEMLRSLGFDRVEMASQGEMIVVHSVHVNYRLPARLDDKLTATASIVGIRKTGLTMEQKIISEATGQLLADAHIKLACVKKESMKPCRMPEKLTIALQR